MVHGPIFLRYSVIVGNVIERHLDYRDQAPTHTIQCLPANGPQRVWRWESATSSGVEPLHDLLGDMAYKYEKINQGTEQYNVLSTILSTKANASTMGRIVITIYSRVSVCVLYSL